MKTSSEILNFNTENLNLCTKYSVLCTWPKACRALWKCQGQNFYSRVIHLLPCWEKSEYTVSQFAILVTVSVRSAIVRVWDWEAKGRRVGIGDLRKVAFAIEKLNWKIMDEKMSLSSIKIKHYTQNQHIQIEIIIDNKINRKNKVTWLTKRKLTYERHLKSKT